MKLRALQDKVIIKQVEADEVSAGGIVIAGQQEKPLKGKVISVGPGVYLDSGELIKLTTEVGDTVLFGKQSGEEIEFEDEKFIVLREREIVAVIDDA